MRTLLAQSRGMMVETTPSQTFRFGGFSLDLARGILLRGDQTLFLRPKAYGILTHLARNMGRVVPKGELFDTVWPGVFVTEDSLTQSVREIRKAIGDDLVRTVPKRGYILAAEGESVPEVGSQPIVAVLRFRNEGEAAGTMLIDGFAEDIINGIAAFGHVTVLARNSSFSFMSFERSEWPQIRARTGADYIVEGAVRRQGEDITATINLVDAANSVQLWGHRYQASRSGMFEIGQDIVEDIVGRLVVRVSTAGLEQAMRKPVPNLAAHELILRGTALLRDPAQTDIETARVLFEEAVAKDPDSGLAHIYLGLTHALVDEFGGASATVLAEARDIVNKGIALAPHLATGHRVRSLLRLYMREHEAAEHSARTALEFNRYDPECIGQMGNILVMRGRPIEAMEWLARAIRIDPIYPHWYQFDRSMTLYMLGEYRQAAEALELATRPTPWIRTRLAACYAQAGDMIAARRNIDLIQRDYPGFSPLDYARSGVPFEHAADGEHLAEGVAAAFGEH
jgi:TolB-like protein/Tfp pilus assembly protein PilF